MGKYRQKKQVVKEAFEITSIQVSLPSGHYEVVIENGENIIFLASQTVAIGDFIVTQSADDRYHCPRDVFLNGYEKVTTTTTILNPENTTTK